MGPDNNPSQQLYEILGLAPGATVKEIKKAFRRLAKTLHPDKNSSADATEKFKELNNAYAELLLHTKNQKLEHDKKPDLEKTRQIWGIWKLRLAYSPETPNLGKNRWCFVPCDLEIWWMTLENNRASLLCCFKLCATFHSHWWIRTGVTVRKRPNLGQIRQFLEPCDLAIWRMTLKNNRAPLLFYFKLCASFRNHWCIETWVTVRKRQIWVKFDDF